MYKIEYIDSASETVEAVTFGLDSPPLVVFYRDYKKEIPVKAIPIHRVKSITKVE